MEGLKGELDEQGSESAQSVKSAAKQIANMVDLYSGLTTSHQSIAAH